MEWTETAVIRETKLSVPTARTALYAQSLLSTL